MAAGHVGQQINGWKALCAGGAVANELLDLLSAVDKALLQVIMELSDFNMEQAVLAFPHLCPVLESLGGKAMGVCGTRLHIRHASSA